MCFRKLFALFFLGLLVLGLFGFFGRSGSRYDEAYRQGFIDGQRAAVSSEAAPKGTEGAETAVPGGRSGTQVVYHENDFFFPAPSFLLFLVPLFAFSMLFMKSSRRHRYGRHSGWAGPCGRGPWGAPPWKQGTDSPQEKSPGDIDDGPDDLKYV